MVKGFKAFLKKEMEDHIEAWGKWQNVFDPEERGFINQNYTAKTALKMIGQVDPRIEAFIKEKIIPVIWSAYKQCYVISYDSPESQIHFSFNDIKNMTHDEIQHLGPKYVKDTGYIDRNYKEVEIRFFPKRNTIEWEETEKNHGLQGGYTWVKKVHKW